MSPLCKGVCIAVCLNCKYNPGWSVTRSRASRLPVPSSEEHYIIKLFAVPKAVATIVPCNDTRRNEFPHLQCNNFLQYYAFSVHLPRPPTRDTYLVLRRLCHPCS